MIAGSAAIVSERLPPASCIRMIAPGLGAGERALHDRLVPGQRVVGGVGRPQDHQHVQVVELAGRWLRRTSRREGGTGAAAGAEHLDASDLFEQLFVLVVRESWPSSGWVSVWSPTTSPERSSATRARREILLLLADREERRVHVQPVELATSCWVYGPGPSSKVSATSLPFEPPLVTAGV